MYRENPLYIKANEIFKVKRVVTLVMASGEKLVIDHFMTMISRFRDYENDHVNEVVDVIGDAL